MDLNSKDFKLSKKEISNSSKSVSNEVKNAINLSYDNVNQFALGSMRKNWEMRNAQGAIIGESFQPFNSVGIYVPGGTAPLVSTSLMTVAIAKAVNCLLYTSPSPRDRSLSRMPSSA